jgi:hypothetical protein
MGAGEMTCQPVLKVMPRWQMKKKGNLFWKKKEYESEISRKAKGYEKVEAVGREVKEKGSWSWNKASS